MGNVSQRFMDPVWGGGKSFSVCSSPSFGSVLALPSSSFSPMLFWDWSPSATLQAFVPGVSPGNQVHLGRKSTPREGGGVGSWMVPEPGSRERLMERPEGCYKREGGSFCSLLASATVGAGGRWSEEGYSQHHWGGQHMAYFQCHFVGFASVEGEILFRDGLVCKLPPPAWEDAEGAPHGRGCPVMP